MKTLLESGRSARQSLGEGAEDPVERVPAAVVAARLGHPRPSFTQDRYIKHAAGSDAAAADALREAFTISPLGAEPEEETT